MITSNNIVYRGNWAFISSNSEPSRIQSTNFGDGYVIIFTSKKSSTEKFAALAHIDVYNNNVIKTIQLIFNKFTSNSVSVRDIQVQVLGGWEIERESRDLGNQIKAEIMKTKVGKIDTSLMFSKHRDSDQPHFFSAGVDAKTLEYFISTTDEDKNLKQQQDWQTVSRLKKSQCLNSYPMTELIIEQLIKTTTKLRHRGLSKEESAHIIVFDVCEDQHKIESSHCPCSNLCAIQ